MDRLEWIRTIVDDTIDAIQDPIIRKLAYIHTYGVVQNATLLAMKRHSDIELCTIAAMLHDFAVYKENTPHKDHAQRSAILAKEILENSKLFKEDEIVRITHAISEHSNKMMREDGVITEILKDSDALAHYLYNTNIELSTKDRYRLLYLLEDINK